MKCLVDHLPPMLGPFIPNPLVTRCIHYIRFTVDIGWRTICVFAQVSRFPFGFQCGTAQYCNGRTQSVHLFYRNGAVSYCHRQFQFDNLEKDNRKCVQKAPTIRAHTVLSGCSTCSKQSWAMLSPVESTNFVCVKSPANRQHA